jgi:hypothetical protein
VSKETSVSHTPKKENWMPPPRIRPPFEPSTMHGLARHHVFVNDAEAVFIFEGASVGEAVERLIRNPQVWLAATEWRDCLAGRPTVLPCQYAWSRRPRIR